MGNACGLQSLLVGRAGGHGIDMAGKAGIDRFGHVSEGCPPAGGTDCTRFELIRIHESEIKNARTYRRFQVIPTHLRKVRRLFGLLSTPPKNLRISENDRRAKFRKGRIREKIKTDLGTYPRRVTHGYGYARFGHRTLL
jgi:hypothetical protein